MQDLEEVEAWLNHVEQWVWMEPLRMFDNQGSLTREVIHEFNLKKNKLVYIHMYSNTEY